MSVLVVFVIPYCLLSVCCCCFGFVYVFYVVGNHGRLRETTAVAEEITELQFTKPRETTGDSGRPRETTAATEENSE